jgi:hypothetical protein
MRLNNDAGRIGLCLLSYARCLYVQMNRIGFRRLLPIVLLLTHAALLLFTSVSQREPSSGVDSYPPISDMPPKPLTVAQRTFLVLNLPALLLSVPVVMLISSNKEFPSLYASLPFVPLVWYFVGRWIDGLMGYLPQPRRIRKLRWLLVLLFALLLCLGIASVTLVNHHRTGDEYWLLASLIGWSGLFFVISISGLVRRVLSSARVDGGLIKHHRLVPIQKHPVLNVPPHAAREHDFL